MLVTISIILITKPGFAAISRDSYSDANTHEMASGRIRPRLFRRGGGRFEMDPRLHMDYNTTTESSTTSSSTPLTTSDQSKTQKSVFQTIVLPIMLTSLVLGVIGFASYKYRMRLRAKMFALKELESFRLSHLRNKYETL